MPNLNQYGVSIGVDDVGDRQTPSAPTPPTAIAPIQVRKYVRNGKAPSAELANKLNGAANFAALYRSKEVFSTLSAMPKTGSPAGSPRWRFAFHTSINQHALWSVVGMLNPYLASATQAKMTLKIYSDASETTLVASADYNYGPGTNSGGFGWRQAKWPMAWIDGLSPDTDYYGRFDLSGSPNAFCAAVFEMVSLTETYGGYITQSLTSHSPVFGVDRSNVHALLRNVWKRGGSKVLNWVVKPGIHDVGQDSTETNSVSVTTTSTTLTNILDLTSTTVSSSTPGWYADMQNKDRVSQTSGVPCVMKVFGRGTTGGTSTNLQVVLKNAAGTTLATCTSSGGTNAWFSSGTFNLPAAAGKLDIQFKTTTSPARAYLYAVSIWEQE